MYPNLSLSSRSQIKTLYKFLMVTNMLHVLLILLKTLTKLKLNSVAFSLQANYTDRATAACRRS
jgi:hypothetical protein